MSHLQPRAPFPEERQHLTAYIASKYAYSDDPTKNLEEASRLVDNAYIAVFDDYPSGSPGYIGKVMSVIWDGSPSQYEVYTWNNGQLVLEEQETI